MYTYTYKYFLTQRSRIYITNQLIIILEETRIKEIEDLNYQYCLNSLQ